MLKEGRMKMKYLVYAGLVALIALVCLPAGVSAALTDTVVVSGSIGGSLDVDVTPNGGVSWGAMSVGTKQDLTTADLTVTTTYPVWHVNAADASVTHKGYMNDVTSNFNLTNAFQISNNGATGPWTAYDRYVYQLRPEDQWWCRYMAIRYRPPAGNCSPGRGGHELSDYCYVYRCSQLIELSLDRLVKFQYPILFPFH